MTSTAVHSDAPDARPSQRHAITFMAFMSVVLAFGVDIVLPAFDDIRSEFELASGSGAVAPIITWYLLGMGVAQIVHGALSDRFGRKPVLLGGAALYAAGCVLAFVAPSFGWFLGARFVWGLGAAALGVIYPAIASDLYSGDEMARVVSIVVAVFLIGPILTPILGELLIGVLPWRVVIVASFLVVVAQMTWTVGFSETLPVSARRSLSAGPLMGAVRRVLTTRQTVGHLAALTFLYGAFYIFLSSSQPIIDEIYGRGGQFAWWFGFAAVPAALSLTTSQRLVARFGARRVIVPAAGAMLIAAVTWLAMAVAADGTPAFGWWFGVLLVVNSLLLVQTPLHTALALEPLGDIAGTASSFVGLCGLVGGATLSSIVNSRITDSVVPMAVGYVGFGAVSLVCLWWAGGVRRPVSTAV